MTELITKEDFELRLSNATTFGELIPLVSNAGHTWDGEDYEDEETRLFEKVFSLITSTSEASELWEESDSGFKGRDDRLWNKMLELATSHEDLDTIFDIIATSHEREEIKRRNYIRKLFNKADELGYPVEDTW